MAPPIRRMINIPFVLLRPFLFSYTEVFTTGYDIAFHVSNNKMCHASTTVAIIMKPIPTTIYANLGVRKYNKLLRR